ncbi:hypothetical protein GCM10010191_63150 [Actinomadura vinacea]|uniref:HEAT repeat domain-containing protein n=1 Tax=Actinomadura vinacea TaxID=115336 RepID=A0ABN3JTV3_9ACTN
MSPIRPVSEPAEGPAEAADALLAGVEPLPYPLRMRELALHARRLAGTPELAALLSELFARGRYERRTALHMAMAARDLGHVAAALAGPDMELRRAALRAVRTLPVPDEAAEAVLEDAPSVLRRALYRTLLHARRRALADRLLPLVRERWGDREAAVLLPACSGPAVAEALPGLAHAVVTWRALGKRHPDLVLDAAVEETAERDNAVQPSLWGWWRRRGAGVQAAAERVPGRVLALMEEHDRRGQLPRVATFSPTAVGALFKADSARTARLLLRGVWWLHPGVRSNLLAFVRSCPLEDLLQGVPTRLTGLRTILEVLPPGRREAVLDAVVKRGSGVLTELRALPLLDLLPSARAAAEARRMLDWHGSVRHSSRSRADDPNLPLKIKAYLPYDEAAGPLGEAALSGDAQRRSLARSLLLECAARTGDRAVVTELVTKLALRSVNELDPVRASLLGALVALRPVHYDDAWAGPLGRLAASAIEARDSSPGTRRVLRALAARVLRHAEGPLLTDWALGVYERLMARHGADGLAPAEPELEPRRRRGRRPRAAADDHRLDRVLRRGQERDLLDRLRPHLRAARGRGDFSLVVCLAAALGRRAHGLAELQDDLRAAIVQAPESVARDAAHLWLAHPGSREERAADLLRADPATIVHPRVWRVAAGSRTDLLVPALDGAPGDWVPEVVADLPRRWTPAQRDRVHALLGARAGDESLPVESRLAAVRSLGRVPGTVGDLAVWAGREDSVLADAALEALAHGDEPAGALGLLLDQARGLASPVAVAAMGRCCSRVRPARLGRLLHAAVTGPDSKVTVRKQAVRQLERHRPPHTADILLRAWQNPDLHKDVRVAVAAALRHMPGTPGVLEALSDAAGPYAGEEMHRTLFQAQPWGYAPAHRPRYAALVRRLLNAAEGPGVRFRASRAFGVWAPWYEGGFGEIIAAVGDPADPAGRRELPVFVTLMNTGMVRTEVVEVLGRLLAAGMGPEARARVSRIVRALSAFQTQSHRRDLARQVVDLLAPHPLYLEEAARLAVDHLPVTKGNGGTAPHGSAGELEGELLALAGRLRERPVLAAQVCEKDLRRRLSGYRNCFVPPALLLPIARRLLEEDHLAAGLMAVTLADVAGPEAGWPDGWRELADRLRGSEHVDIAAGAWAIEVPGGAAG